MNLALLAVVAQAASPATPIAVATEVSVWRGKPPLATHGVDVTVHNPDAATRWILVSDAFRPATAPAPGDGPVDRGTEGELQVYRLPKATLIKAVYAELWAIRLPAGATVTLRHLNVDSNADASPAALDVLVATEVTVGTVKLEELVPNALSAAGDVSADLSAAQMTSAWHPAAGASPVVHVDVDGHATVDVAFTH